MSQTSRIARGALFAFALIGSVGVGSASAAAPAGQLAVEELEEDAAGGKCRIWCLTHQRHETIDC